MAERMLVTQALDERDLMVKKIRDKISRASFVDTRKRNEEKVYNARISQEEFGKKAASSYQQIMDLMDRFQRLEAAIVASNASVFVETSYGRMSVAGAIALRSRLRQKGTFTDAGDFEGFLYKKMSKEYADCLSHVEEKNRALAITANEMRMSILGKDTRTKEEKPLEVVAAYVRENTAELVDPLGLLKKMEVLQEKREVLLRELDTQIKVANATTFIEF